VQVTRKSPISGKEHTLDLPITAHEAFLFERGALIQDAFPNLSPAEREFILTGITDEEWTTTFGDDDELFEDNAELSKLQAGAPSPEDGKR